MTPPRSARATLDDGQAAADDAAPARPAKGARKATGKTRAAAAAPAPDVEEPDAAELDGELEPDLAGEIGGELGEPVEGATVDPAVVAAADPTMAAAVADGPSVDGAAAPAAEDDDEDDDDETPSAVEDDDEDEKPIAAEGEVGISTDLVRAYLKEIGKVPLLTAEQEVELAQRIEAGLFASEKIRQAEEGEAPKLSPALKRDLEWLVNDGARAKRHLL
ncbi:MAG TPA: sigma-70 factor domain-containing protein, partial [Mycobacteriales bacterium]|nr:sigma-70 factor domain-containing protein [Mycobacteriales bacterium]